MVRSSGPKNSLKLRRFPAGHLIVERVAGGKNGLYDHAYTQSPFGPFVQVVARARCCESMTRGGLRRGEGRSALVVRDEVVKLDLGTAKDVERRTIREVDFAVRESFDESEVVGACENKKSRWSEGCPGKRNLVSCGSVGHIHALLAPPAYVHGIVLHSPSSTGQSKQYLSAPCKGRKPPGQK